MLRLLLLCIFATAGLSLSAQDAAAKTSCAKSCKKVAGTSCQAKTTSVASTTAPAPSRATEIKEEAPKATAQPALFKLTSLEAPKANCEPANCKPANCQPAACQKTTTAATAQPAKTTKSTAVALKQE